MKDTQLQREKKRTLGISGSTLKIIAIISMFIDHIGAVLLIRLYYAGACQSPVNGYDISDLFKSGQLLQLYTLSRKIGRLAFPIFCFLLVEGFLHTKDVRKYFTRLGIFAIISEIPFDLAFSSKPVCLEAQNVFITLFIALMALFLISRLPGLVMGRLKLKSQNWIIVGMVLVSSVFAGLAQVIYADYGAAGVLCIIVLYIFRSSRLTQCLAGAVSFWWDGIASFSFVPILFYNGQRGLKIKYFFYLFYPVHLIMLFLICHFLGITNYAIIK